MVVEIVFMFELNIIVVLLFLRLVRIVVICEFVVLL